MMLYVKRQNQYKDIKSITHGHKNDQKLQDFSYLQVTFSVLGLTEGPNY